MPPASPITGFVFFTLHHIIALSAYFDWRITLIGSVGVLASCSSCGTPACGTPAPLGDCCDGCRAGTGCTCQP